ncbi:phage portal protein [Devosia sp. MC1541]|uniref:anti-CBASS protein Acb1 family protein n=1 Tax=Devosia sp. MC1541 TaxID=2725264 RepID=UPI00145F6928|nr:anti-CBASS Acb1 family protein [Devosia sp. MC1541]
MNPLALIVNAARRLDNMFPGYFEKQQKHNHYADFGYPANLTFTQLHQMYSRNGIARAGIEKTILKTWQDTPFLLEAERDGSEGKLKKETPLEKEIRLRFDQLRLWQHLAEADRRSLVGKYSGLILRLGDNKRFNEAVDTVGGGLLGLVEVIPAWEGQLTVGEWETDETSENYGQPKMYQFNEAQVGDTTNKTRQFDLHPDRVLIWSKDGTVHGQSLLEPGYNSLLDMEKISGAGGEGFWKNAKSAPVLQVDKEAKPDQMAKAMGIDPSELVDKIGEQVEDWNKGFDKLLMLQGIEAKTLGVNLPSPEHFFAIALQSFAASIPIPLKILVGSQTGERASTEDAKEWAQTNMSRRAGQVIPNTMALVKRLAQFSILPEKDWFLDWTDLTESSMAEKIDRVVKMADTNQKMKDSKEAVFSHEEMRAVVDYEPLSDADKFRDDITGDDADDALNLPTVAQPE